MTAAQQLPGISLSGPILLDISVNSLRILPAFLASDFRLAGIGLFTVKETLEDTSFFLPLLHIPKF